MGNIFPLSERPSCFEATIKLIEKSFQYKRPHSFEIDFAPLVDKSNHHNCFILIDENEKLLAHVGAKERVLTLNGVRYPIVLLGGIAVDEERRGEGIFQTLFQDVLAEKRSDTCLFLLWSDLEKLYNKFGFHLCGTQFEITSEKKPSPFTKTTYKELSAEDQKSVRNLYEKSFRSLYLSLERSDADWRMLSNVTSADLYVRKEKDQITEYYFMNKGQDLPGVIYEYGTANDVETFLKELSSYGKLWLGKDILSSENLQYQFFMGPGDTKLFAQLIFELTKKQFNILNINLMKQEVFFDFNEETLSLELHDFLRGVFGPGSFEEIDVPSLFISGLDSV